MEFIIMTITFAFLCFVSVYILKNGEKKYRYDKTKAVETFVNENKISVTKWYSGQYCDLIDDQDNKTIWFFVLEQKLLKYKEIAYDELFYVGLTYDSQIIDEYKRSGQMKKEMLGGDGFDTLSLGIPGDIKDFQVVKNMSITIVVDDRHAAVIEALFHAYSLYANIKNVKDDDIKYWFHRFGNIIEEEENELRIKQTDSSS